MWVNVETQRAQHAQANPDDMKTWNFSNHFCLTIIRFRIGWLTDSKAKFGISFQVGKSHKEAMSHDGIRVSHDGTTRLVKVAYPIPIRACARPGVYLGEFAPIQFHPSLFVLVTIKNNLVHFCVLPLKQWSRLNFYEIQDLPLFLSRFWALKRECSELHDRWKAQKRPKRKVKIEFRRDKTSNRIFVRKV